MFRILGKLFEVHFGFKACIMLLILEPLQKFTQEETFKAVVI